MKQRQRKATRISPFAQFFGRAPRAEDQDDDDLDEDRKQRDDESDEDYARRMAALDDDTKDPDEDEDDKDPDADDSKDVDDPDADDLKDDDPDADDTKDPDEDEDEDKPSDAKKAAREAERKRCAAIVAHGVKMQRTMLACSFAFGTDLTAKQAKAALDAAMQDAQASKPRHRSLGDRMAAVQPANPGANGGKRSGNPAKSLADRIVAVGERVRQK